MPRYRNVCTPAVVTPIAYVSCRCGSNATSKGTPRRARGPPRSPRIESCSRASCTIVQDDPHRRLVASRACTNGIAGAMPDGGAATALVLTSLAIMGSPGPATISLTAAGSAFGVRPAVARLPRRDRRRDHRRPARGRSGDHGRAARCPARCAAAADRGLGGVHPLACVPRCATPPACTRTRQPPTRPHWAAAPCSASPTQRRGSRSRPSSRAPVSPTTRSRTPPRIGADGDDRADQRGLARRRCIPRRHFSRDPRRSRVVNAFLAVALVVALGAAVLHKFVTRSGAENVSAPIVRLRPDRDDHDGPMDLRTARRARTPRGGTARARAASRARPAARRRAPTGTRRATSA